MIDYCSRSFNINDGFNIYSVSRFSPQTLKLTRTPIILMW